MTPTEHCIDCGNSIWKGSSRCRSCSNLFRWSRDDPRRNKIKQLSRNKRQGNTPYEDREWMRVRYEDRSMSLRQIAKEGQCGLRTIARWMAIHAIPCRDNLAARRLAIRTGPKNPNWRGGHRYVCPRCGSKKSYMARTCKRCNDRRGPAGSNWRGGITSANALERASKKYEDWRLAVFERDRYTCQLCGDNKGGNLNAHHIKPFAKFPELRFVVSNGSTICESCHVQIHVGPPVTRPKPVGCTKLTLEQRNEIRSLYASKSFTQKQLGKKYGVSVSTISCLVRSAG